MDIQTASRLCGRKWQFARIGALIFFGLACGLLISSLVTASKAGIERGGFSRTVS